jgi:hypothetical protein
MVMQYQALLKRFNYKVIFNATINLRPLCGLLWFSARKLWLREPTKKAYEIVVI